jgi:hypothetical protein
MPLALATPGDDNNAEKTSQEIDFLMVIVTQFRYSRKNYGSRISA